MTEEMKQEILNLIKENLTIRVKEKDGFYAKDVVVELSIEGEVFSEDSYTIESKM